MDDSPPLLFWVVVAFCSNVVDTRRRPVVVAKEERPHFQRIPGVIADVVSAPN